MTTTLALARDYLARGLSVFPVPRGSKIPDQPWKVYQSRLATDDELVGWFSDADLNIGIATGALSGVVVVDADTPQAVRYCVRRLSYTPWQTKTSRGFHLWFASPGFPVPNRGTDLLTTFGPLPIHVRGDGGYVLAAGSVHPSGTLYTQAGKWTEPRAALPRFWPGWLQPLGPPRPRCAAPTPAPTTSTDFLVERARRYLAAIPVPEIGHGSDTATLSAACRLVRGFGLSAADAEALLWQWAGHRDGWTIAWIADKVANAERYGTEAIGALR